jgi:hypothetical protein
MTITRRMFLALFWVRPPQQAFLRVTILETFQSERACAALVHHAEPSERDAFARRLQARPRSDVRVRTGTGEEVEATMFRVRMCFGRGLILLSKPVQIHNGDVLMVLA